jgi:CMP-N-acetylneuraminic acid synthetase
MRILALILARGGSKRLKNKNLRKIKGKSLVSIAISFAKKLNYIENILVSTDSKKILKEAKKNKVLTPWLRPKFLSRDSSSVVDSGIHALNWYERKFNKIDGVLLLQPTSPIRILKTFHKGIKFFIKNKSNPVVGVSIYNKKLIDFVKVNKNKAKAIFKKKNIKSFSEKQVFKINGSFYLISPKMLRDNKSFICKRFTPLIMKSFEESIDIDDKRDLKLANFFFKTKK